MSTDIEMVEQSIDGSTFTFTGADIGDLGEIADSFTVVTLVTDRSGSVGPFKNELEECKRKIVKACARSPLPDNLIIRDLAFGSTVEELHGFKPLANINPDDYIGSIQIEGMTAAFDATYDAIQATSQYGKGLRDQDMEANGVVFVITDGWDNRSTHTPEDIKKSLANIVQAETLESLNVILIGVGASSSDIASLQALKDECGFTQFVNIGDATPENLAKLADFVSQSISAQSQALGTGGPSQALQF